jgi:hypothetical protein
MKRSNFLLSLPAKRDINTEYRNCQSEKERAKEQEQESERNQYTIQSFSVSILQPGYPTQNVKMQPFAVPSTRTHEANEQRSRGREETYRASR